MDLKQRIFSAYINYWWHHLTEQVVKVSLSFLLVVGVATPVVITVKPIHKPSQKPWPVQVVKNTHKVVAATTPKTSAQSAIAPANQPVTEVPKPAVTPQPISATAPSPGSGAKKLSVNPPPAAPTTDPSPTTTSPTSDTSTPAGGTTAASTPALATGGYSSTNWSGYVATNSKFTTVSGSWKATAASGNGSTQSADSTWIGIGGVFSGDLIQTGTMNLVEPDGTFSVFAFYELLPDSALAIPSLTVSAGDSMTASITEISPSNWQITLSDATTGQTFTTTTTYSSQYSTAEWIQEDPSYASGSLVPLDQFGTATFTNGTTTANGALTSLSAAKISPITLVNSAGKPLAIPSVLVGNGFNVYQQ